ncbi:MAG: hypothetical protein WCK39_03810 [Methanomassiliicoccales archaeon]
MELMDFMTILILVFALFMVLAGIFTAYFGSGKSRTIGVVLLLVGLIVGVAWAYMAMSGGGNVIHLSTSLSTLLWNAFIYIVAALIGALIAIGVFLLAIMKS